MSATNAKFTRFDCPSTSHCQQNIGICHRVPRCRDRLYPNSVCIRFPVSTNVPRFICYSCIFELTRFVIQINVKISISFCCKFISVGVVPVVIGRSGIMRVRQQCEREPVDRKETPNGFFYYIQLAQLNFTN